MFADEFEKTSKSRRNLAVDRRRRMRKRRKRRRR